MKRGWRGTRNKRIIWEEMNGGSTGEEEGVTAEVMGRKRGAKSKGGGGYDDGLFPLLHVDSLREQLCVN